MTINEYLHICRDKRIEAAKIREKYFVLRTKATAPPGIDPDRVRHKSQSGREDLIIKMIQVKEQADLAEINYLRERQKLFDIINRLPLDPGTALYIRYILEKKNDDEALEAWKYFSCGKEICRKTFYRHLKDGKALLKEILDKDGVKIE